jgi:predicted house-cleaning noncanonical NTP pyrophosphatase (MazG superfamily)
MIEFNKLVRDKIPDIIRANNETPHYRIIENDDEYLQALFLKDAEEGMELSQNLSLEELADKLEVIYAIAKTRGYTPEQIEQARLEKLSKRGGFEGRVFLKSTN